jgi:hypothetical protein
MTAELVRHPPQAQGHQRPGLPTSTSLSPVRGGGVDPRVHELASGGVHANLTHRAPAPVPAIGSECLSCGHPALINETCLNCIVAGVCCLAFPVLIGCAVVVSGLPGGVP